MRPADKDAIFCGFCTIPDENVYGLEAGKFKETKDEAYAETYTKVGKKLVKALLEYLRQEQARREKRGLERFTGGIKIVFSCYSAEENGKRYPDRPHVHFLVWGSHGTTKCELIRDYWDKRFCFKKDGKELNPIIGYLPLEKITTRGSPGNPSRTRTKAEMVAYMDRQATYNRVMEF